jgi:antitoxin (DNA-binding transcriptional repressor) of toxin-antitoxin stability system
MGMRTVGIRELKNRLSEYLRLVRRGEEVLVTDRGVVIAELRQPGRAATEAPYPALLERAERGTARLGGPNQPDLYPELEPALREGEAARLLDLERGER